MRLTVNDISIPLLPGETIELTRSNAQVSRLGNRSGSYTSDFQAPMTAETAAALGYANLLESENDIKPEKKQPAALYRDTGGEIARGFVQIVKADYKEKAFTLTFFTGNTSWIDLLRGKSIRDVWLDDYIHTWTAANIVASWTNTEGYIYPWVDYGRLTYQTNTRTFIEDWYPAVFQHTLIQRMFENIGWVAKGSFINSWMYKHTIIPFVNEKFLENNAPSLIATAKKASVTDYELIEVTASAASNSSTQTLDIDTIVTDNIGAFSLPLDRYTADRTLNNATFVFTLPAAIATVGFGNASSTTGTITLQIEKNGVVIESIELVTATGSGSVSGTNSGDFVISTTQNLVATDYIDCSVLLEYSGATIGVTIINLRLATTQFFFQLTSVDSEILPGGNVTLNNNLPDIDQADFVRDMIFRHGLLAIPDQYSQTVTFEPFDTIINNADQAQNLSDYVNILSAQSIDFTQMVSDYAKQSRFFYKKPSDDDSFITNYNKTERIEFGGGELAIDNDFIESRKEIFRSVFEPTYQLLSINTVFAGGVYLPYIPRISYDGSETLRTDARVLLVVQNTPVNDFNTGSVSNVFIDGVSYSNTAFAYFSKPLLNSDLDNIDISLAFDIPNVQPSSGEGMLDTYFPRWRAILDKPRFSELGVKLFPQQFDGLNLSLPVYVESENIRGYFLLDEVVYRDGEDLLRLIQLQV